MAYTWQKSQGLACKRPLPTTSLYPDGLPLLEGSWAVLSRVISVVALLTTLLLATHEPSQVSPVTETS